MPRETQAFVTAYAGLLEEMENAAAFEPVTASAEVNDLNDRVAAGWAKALPLEERLAAKYEQAGRALAKRARGRYERAQPVIAAARPPNWLPQPDELVTPEDAAAAAARTQAQRRAIVQAMVGSILGIEASRDAVFRALIEAQAGRQAERLVEGSRDAVARVILDAQVEGWGVPQTAEAIQTELETVAKWQSTMLARTDLISLSNASSVASASLLGADAPPFKVWLATSDNRTRPDHHEAEGQTVPTDQSFTVGGELLAYPGDPSASDSQVCNCRCTVRYAWEPNPGSLTAAYIEEQHPRDPGGEDGGRWVRKGEGKDDRRSVPQPSEDVLVDVDERQREQVADYARKRLIDTDEYLVAATGWMREQTAGQEVRIRAPIENVQAILDSGGFQPAAVEDLGWDRGAMEAQYFGTDERPVYGYLSGIPEDDGHPVASYGDVVFRLKSEVGDRSTVTLGDSANVYVDVEREGTDFAITPLRNPTHEGIDFPYSGDVLDVGLRDFSGTYMEAQVWGGVKLDDVEEVVFLGESEVTPEIRQSLDRAGVKWARNPSQDPLLLSKGARPKVGDVLEHRTWREEDGSPTKMTVTDDYEDTGHVGYRLDRDAPGEKRSASYRQFLHMAGRNPGLTAAFSPSQPRYQVGVREGGRWRPESGEGTLDDLAARHPDVEVWASDHGDGITLHMIRTKPGARGTGAASRALRDLTALADRRGVPMWLTPEAMGDDAPMSTDQLARWYRRHGWAEANGNGLMRREPTRALVAAYVEQQHPRDPGGEGGGRWIPKGTTAQDEKRLADNPKEVGLYGPGQHVWVNGVEHVVTDLRFTDEGVPRVVLTNLETNEERLLAPDFPVQDEAPIAAPVVTKPELLEVTGRRLKDGDTFFTERTNLAGETTREEYRVTDASGRSYLRVVRVSDNKPGLMQKSGRLLVSADRFPDVARAQARAGENHVKGELGKVFQSSPGPNTKITKAVNQASDELGRIVALPDDLPKIPLKETRSMTMGGAFKSVRNRRTGEVTPSEIVLRAAEEPLEMTNNAHHEVGHYLDMAGLGENGKWASEIRHPEVAGPLMDAIDASPPAQRIKAMRFSDADYRIVTNPGDDIFTERRFPTDRAQIRYVDEPQEKFARAYEQYVATRTGGSGRTARYVEGAALPLDDLTLDPGESANGFYGWYWSQQDFEPIATEFDQMFRRVGWSKS